MKKEFRNAIKIAGIITDDARREGLGMSHLRPLSQ